mgnify:FL=1
MLARAGSLLKIEEEIREAASKTKFKFIQWKKHQDKAKWSLFPELVKRGQLNFDLNDGVILNIAPLWELVPWKEPQKYWEEKNLRKANTVGATSPFSFGRSA